MITPVFEISQTDDYLIFKIRAPYAKLADLEVEHIGKQFFFSCTPYYLRINLSHEVQEDEGENTTFNSDTGVFQVTVQKKVKGQFFENLDMITELLRPQKGPSARVLVEELDEQIDDGEDEYYQPQEPKDIEAGVRDEEANLYGYGFGWRRTGVFEQLRSQIGALIDLENPDETPLKDRIYACADFDRRKFDYERYLLDNIQPEDDLKFIINAKFGSETKITEEDRIKLKDLPNKKLHRFKATAYTLVDLVYAWAYDQRVNAWESSCESGWTISRLSPSLCFLVKWNDLLEACTASVRRTLCYPLYRNWDLAMKVLEDTLLLFQTGKSTIVHVIAEIHSIMIKSSDFHYLFNDILITDLLLWLQSIDATIIENIAQELVEIKLEKQTMKLDLEEIELNGRVLLMAVDDLRENLDSDDELE